MAYPEFEPIKIPNIFPADFRRAAILTGVPQPLAAAGSTQSDAGVIAATSTIVSGADGTKGVVLVEPDLGTGQSFNIFNDSASTLKVYPPGTDVINSGAAGAAYSLAAHTWATFILAATGKWFAK